MTILRLSIRIQNSQVNFVSLYLNVKSSSSLHTPIGADVANEGEFEKHELHVIAHWRCASTISLHIFFIFLSCFTRNFIQDQPLFFLVNATLSVTSLHTFTDGNEDGITDGIEVGTAVNVGVLPM